MNTTRGFITCVAVVIVGAIATGCNRDKNNKFGSEIETGFETKFETELISSEKTNLYWRIDITVEYPISGEPILLDSVRTWIDRNLKDAVYDVWDGCHPYGGSLEDGQAMVDHYSEALNEATLDRYDDDEGTSQQEGDTSFTYKGPLYGETLLSIEPVCISNKFVTYNSSYYVYLGGAHGGHSNFYATFLRNNGQLLGWDIFKKNAVKKVCALIEAALDNDYFTEEGYVEPYFYFGKSSSWLYDNRGFPQEGLPGFTEDGIIFQYGEYEIGPYVIGLPYCIIPYDDLLPYMTEKGKAFVKEILSDRNKFYPTSDPDSLKYNSIGPLRPLSTFVKKE